MTQIVRESNRLGEILVKPQSPGDVSADRRHLHGVGQAGAVMVPRPIKEYLRFIFKPAKSARMYDSITIPLILSPPFRRRFLILAASGFAAELRIRGEALLFLPLQLGPLHWHTQPIQLLLSNSCTETPFNSNKRRMTSSI